MSARDIGSEEINNGKKKRYVPLSDRLIHAGTKRVFDRFRPSTEEREKDSHKFLRDMLNEIQEKRNKHERFSDEDIDKIFEEVQKGNPKKYITGDTRKRVVNGKEVDCKVAIVVVSDKMSSKAQNDFDDGDMKHNFLEVVLLPDLSIPTDANGFIEGRSLSQHTQVFKKTVEKIDNAEEATEHGLKKGASGVVNHGKNSVSRAIDDAGHFR